MKRNCDDVPIETEMDGKLETDSTCVMLPEIAAVMSGVGFDVNRTLCSSGAPLLVHAAFEGHEASVRMRSLKTHQGSTSANKTPPMG